MKIPDKFIFREGDLVTVKARVRFDDDGDERLHIELVGSPHTQTTIPREHLLSLEGREWQSGDRVCNANDRAERGTVIAFHKGFAWVEHHPTSHSIYAAIDLEVDPTAPEEV